VGRVTVQQHPYADHPAAHPEALDRAGLLKEDE
jgi:hypothetical protein